MKKVIVEHFRSLDNYGTGMMGLVAVQQLADRLGVDGVEFHCDFDSDEVMEQVRGELCPGVRLRRYVPRDARVKGMGKWRRRFARLWDMLFAVEGRGYDMIIVLGGDDFSEYYGRTDVALALFGKWKSSFVTRVVLLGQTMGPFSSWLNRFAMRRLLPRIEVWFRDRSSAEYMNREFRTPLMLMADLALSGLPLQNDENIALQTINSHELEPQGYVTIIVSAGQKGGKYYARDEADYLACFARIVEELAGVQCEDSGEGLKARVQAGTKIVLLAHTFGRYGDEAGYLRKLYGMLSAGLQERVVLVTEKILPARARIILGSGLFTITGRMHAAVSTFEMGRPAVCLSYSAKFRGVIGDSLGREDMVIDADDNAFWESGGIVGAVIGKVDYLLSDYENICAEIREKVAGQQALLSSTLDRITDEIRGGVR